ncbi:hypothetical protein [Marinomonas sp. FW-1]|uniref:hypothetical protein n=1 Tax=Marinomonas sp. FW-1 TaxID=2071621 RepID=UPI0010C041E0|nr:hypothetical protein [Marinomonas sp. FW-1]
MSQDDKLDASITIEYDGVDIDKLTRYGGPRCGYRPIRSELKATPPVKNVKPDGEKPSPPKKD